MSGVQRIKTKQRGRKCDWCGAMSTQRGFMWGKTACDLHADELKAWDARERRPDYSDAQFYAGY